LHRSDHPSSDLHVNLLVYDIRLHLQFDSSCSKPVKQAAIVLAGGIFSNDLVGIISGKYLATIVRTNLRKWQETSIFLRIKDSQFESISEMVLDEASALSSFGTEVKWLSQPSSVCTRYIVP